MPGREAPDNGATAPNFKSNPKMKQILINSEELQVRVAVVNDGTLEDFFMERTNRDRIVGSIYKGRIKNLEPSLQAAFVDIGVGKNAFLHYWDMLPATQEMLEDGGDGFDDDEGKVTPDEGDAPARDEGKAVEAEDVAASPAPEAEAEEAAGAAEPAPYLPPSAAAAPSHTNGYGAPAPSSNPSLVPLTKAPGLVPLAKKPEEPSAPEAPAASEEAPVSPAEVRAEIQENPPPQQFQQPQQGGQQQGPRERGERRNNGNGNNNGGRGNNNGNANGGNNNASANNGAGGSNGNGGGRRRRRRGHGGGRDGAADRAAAAKPSCFMRILQALFPFWFKKASGEKTPLVGGKAGQLVPLTSGKEQQQRKGGQQGQGGTQAGQLVPLQEKGEKRSGGEAKAPQPPQPQKQPR